VEIILELVSFWRTELQEDDGYIYSQQLEFEEESKTDSKGAQIRGNHAQISISEESEGKSIRPNYRGEKVGMDKEKDDIYSDYDYSDYESDEEEEIWPSRKQIETVQPVVIKSNKLEATEEELAVMMDDILRMRRERDVREKQKGKKETKIIDSYSMFCENNEEEENPDEDWTCIYEEISSVLQEMEEPIAAFNEVRESLGFPSWGAEAIQGFYPQEEDFRGMILSEMSLKVMVTVRDGNANYHKGPKVFGRK
jgi:hypothetical protein